MDLGILIVTSWKQLPRITFRIFFAADEALVEATLPHDNIPRLSEVVRFLIVQLVSKEEVKKDLMSMKSFTAPGVDGFQPFFYKRYWEQVGDALWKLVRVAFEEGKVDEGLVEVLAVLIPKVDQPTTIRDFRPISLCNVTYKLITKVLVNHIRLFLNDTVGPMQNEFLPGHGTMDNVFLAQEIVHHVSKSLSRLGDLAFKIDLEKAYESVSWAILKETLELYGFPSVLVKLIMSCISSSQITILWNGK